MNGMGERGNIRAFESLSLPFLAEVIFLTRYQRPRGEKSFRPISCSSLLRIGMIYEKHSREPSRGQSSNNPPPLRQFSTRAMRRASWCTNEEEGRVGKERTNQRVQRLHDAKNERFREEKS